MTLNFENALFLSAHHYPNFQDIKISFEDVDFYAKLSLILDTLVGNSKTQRTIIHILKWMIIAPEFHNHRNQKDPGDPKHSDLRSVPRLLVRGLIESFAKNAVLDIYALIVLYILLITKY